MGRKSPQLGPPTEGPKQCFFSLGRRWVGPLQPAAHGPPASQGFHHSEGTPQAPSKSGLPAAGPHLQSGKAALPRHTPPGNDAVPSQAQSRPTTSRGGAARRDHRCPPIQRRLLSLLSGPQGNSPPSPHTTSRGGHALYPRRTPPGSRELQRTAPSRARPSTSPQLHGGAWPDSTAEGPLQPAPPLTSCRWAPTAATRQPGAPSTPLRLRPGQTPAGPWSSTGSQGSGPASARPRGDPVRSHRPPGKKNASNDSEPGEINDFTTSPAERHTVTAILPAG
ncbi:hypothetical protein NDU88_004321 [Pleurodeles waltl]|uniref:Uncharacterized protein n=1 Tax=Pleurodeles waltl TaxID=8319 RepID=A0AAV7W4Y0_PLEWA|nr:hypothetical protein NDU88_004321 [Pleurodeles waltl]